MSLLSSIRRLITFRVVQQGVEHTVSGAVGQSLLDAIKAAHIPIQDACEGHLGCGTCGVYLDKKTYKRIPRATKEEAVLLDQVPNPKPTSRLSCAVKLSSMLEGATVRIPSFNKNVLSESDILASEEKKRHGQH
uniref:2Fe-2S ferredoxin n=1 Tax=Giardia intestinalis TaxID=5741 RepID=A8HD15_GIAIN|nr:2Fe-2S ferredoxin [Giardia intestinalis]